MNVEIKKVEGKYILYRNGNPYFIKGIGGNSNLELAKNYGANSFRTWNAKFADKTFGLASQYDMTVMLGIQMSKKNDDYLNEDFKNEKRKEVETVVTNYKDNPFLLIWTIGNEIDLGTNSAQAWGFVNELAILIKNIDKNHPVCTVIAGTNINVLDNIAKYAPNIDVIGVNSYAAGLPNTRKNISDSQFNGPCIITEWGPHGFWEVNKTNWNAPIEQTSTEKCDSYRNGYKYIEDNNDLILGSYVFLWGQKEERTPTWFGMFVETNNELGLSGEICPTVDVMKYSWTGSWPANRAPHLKSFVLNGSQAKNSVVVKSGQECLATVEATDPDGDDLSYTWEILKEATKLGFGGSYEPRPERVSDVITGKDNTIKFISPETGNYRLYVYVLDGLGHVATANIPFMVE